MAILSNANLDIFKDLMDTSTGQKSVYEVGLKYFKDVLDETQISSEQKVNAISSILNTIITQFTIQAMESSRSLAMDDLLFALKQEALELANDKIKAEIEQVQANIELTEAQKKALLDKLPLEIAQIEASIELTNAQKKALLDKLPIEIAQMQAATELTSAQKKALLDKLPLEMAQIEANTELTKTQTQVAAKQIELAQAEIEFNKARTNLVGAQTLSENERTKNIKRERYAMDDQLRIKESEYLTNMVFGYAAGGAMVPQGLQETALNGTANITLKAKSVE